MATETDIIKKFDEHEQKDRDSFASLAQGSREIKQELKKVRQDIKTLQKQVSPMVKQDEHVKWLAQKVVTGIKVAGAVLVVVATAIGIYKAIGGK